MDIFENLRNMLDCQYISDMQTEPNKTMAKKLLMSISLQGYTVEMLSDLAEYLYDEKPEFTTTEQATLYFSRLEALKRKEHL